MLFSVPSVVLVLCSLVCEPQQESTEAISIFETLGKVDFLCVLRTWKIHGVRICVRDGRPHACLIIENAYPCGIMEVVRKPGETHLTELTSILEKIPLPTTSSHSGSLQFAESHVYTFVPRLPFDPVLPFAIPTGPFFQINYLSETDPLGWRIDWLDRFLMPDCFDQAGGWGSYVPRSGFVDNSNEVIASYVTALRAGRAANHPVGRFCFSEYPFEPRTGHYLQTIQPKRKPCFLIGSPITLVEKEALSIRGSYFLIHFGIFEVCHGCDPVRLATERRPTW